MIVLSGRRRRRRVQQLVHYIVVPERSPAVGGWVDSEGKLFHK